MSVQLLEFYLGFFCDGNTPFLYREIKSFTTEIKSRTMWDAGLMGVVVFIEQIFKLVQRRNLVINYNVHNPLCIFPAQTETDQRIRRSERFRSHQDHSKNKYALSTLRFSKMILSDSSAAYLGRLAKWDDSKQYSMGLWQSLWGGRRVQFLGRLSSLYTSMMSLFLLVSL